MADRSGQPSEFKPDRVVGIRFLMTEVDTGLLFAQIAFLGGNADRVTRSIGNARLAYDTILRFRDRVEMSELAADHLAAGLERLRKALRELGEDV